MRYLIILFLLVITSCGDGTDEGSDNSGNTYCSSVISVVLTPDEFDEMLAESEGVEMTGTSTNEVGDLMISANVCTETTVSEDNDIYG